MALFSRRLISALLDFVRNNTSERLQSSLDDAITSLRYATEPGIGSIAAQRAVFDSYEQLKTLEELFPEKMDRERMLGTLNQLRHPGPEVDRETMRKAAKSAIDFFLKIENRALRNVNRYPEPSVVLAEEACRAT